MREKPHEHWARDCFDKPITKVIPAYDDPDADYSFDLMDLVMVDKKWYLVHTSGCSCPSYEDNAGIEYGPGTFRQIRKHIEAEYPQDHYKDYRTQLLEALDKEIAAEKAAKKAKTDES